MRIGRTASSLGSTIGTAELEAPNRASDHWSAGYVDQSASRLRNTNYTAGTTARCVAVSLTGMTSTDVLTVLIAGSEAYRVSATAVAKGVFFIVPPGVVYQVQAATGAITAWRELDL